MSTFRFQTLLNYRERIVEDRQIELAEAQRAQAAAEADLHRLQRDRARYEEGLQGLIQGILRIDEIDHHYRYLATLEVQIEAQQVRVAETEAAVEAVRARLEAALKDRKTLEKLKEYDDESLQAALRQYEANTLDDLNIVRYRRA
jgi:flagellar FliJ protein